MQIHIIQGRTERISIAKHHQCDREINTSKLISVNPFPHYIGSIIAPKRSYQTIFVKGNIDTPFNNFTVTIKYETLGKIITTSHLMNFDIVKTDTATKPKDVKSELEVLNKINQNIHLLARK